MRKTRYVVAALAAGVLAAVAFAAVAGAQPARKQADSLSGAGLDVRRTADRAVAAGLQERLHHLQPGRQRCGHHRDQNRTVDFGASDAPLTVDQFISCHGCVMLPWALAATAVLYNLPGVKNNLHLTGGGRWDLPRQDHEVERRRHHQAQPGRDLPTPTSRRCTAVTARARRTTSPTTCRRSSPSARTRSATTRPSTGRRPSAPAGAPACRACVTRTPGAVGYADVAYALANKLQFAAVQNKSGKFALPGIRGIEAAAANVRQFDSPQLPLDREPAEGQVRERVPDLHLHLRDPAVADAEGRRAQGVRQLGDHERAAARQKLLSCRSRLRASPGQSDPEADLADVIRMRRR